MLWSQRAPAQSKKYLRQTLWQVHSALAAHGQDGEDASLLLVDDEWIRCNPSCDLWLDVAVFEGAYDQAQGIAGSDLDETRSDGLRAAVQLYSGDLLQGCYEDWCLFERERLQNMYLGMLDKLVVFCEVNGEYEAGLAFGSRALRVDRARERTHRQMMRLYCLSRNRSDALRQYERCVEALREELDVEPSRRTLDLVEWIRAGKLEDAAPAVTSVNGDSPDRALPEVLTRLRQLQTLLFGIQGELQQDIEVVETALHSRR
jgi:DNA-binding SARP family transcriptional activator